MLGPHSLFAKLLFWTALLFAWVTAANAQIGVIALSSATYETSEDAGPLTITLTRSGGSDGAVSAIVTVSAETAISGDDYVADSFTVNWGAGQSGDRTITIELVDDEIPEDDETFSVEITQAFPVGNEVQLGNPASAVVTITDDDTIDVGLLSLSSATYSVVESAGSVSVIVTRSGGADGAVSAIVTVSDVSATAGDDYVAASFTVNWGAGQSGDRTITIELLDDGLPEDLETFSVEITEAFPVGNDIQLGEIVSAVVTITDDDSLDVGLLTLSSPTYSVSESAGSVSVTVTRSGGSDGPVSATVATSSDSATSGSDFAASSVELNWAAGELGDRTVTIPIIDDGELEDNETFTVQITQAFPVGNEAQLGVPFIANVTIIDNDDVGLISFVTDSYSVLEGAETVTVTLNRSGGTDGLAIARVATSSESAESSTDFISTTVDVVWQSGQSGNRTVTISLIDDSLPEEDESFSVEITEAFPVGNEIQIGTPASTTITVVDDDVLKLSLERFGDSRVLSWNTSGAILETVLDLSDPWVTAQDQSNPQTINLTGQIRFYRLRSQ